MQPAGCDEASYSKPRGITELNFENFSEAEANHVANDGECLSSNPQNPESGVRSPVSRSYTQPENTELFACSVRDNPRQD
jgi:hypothetical protein